MELIKRAELGEVVKVQVVMGLECHREHLPLPWKPLGPCWEF